MLTHGESHGGGGHEARGRRRSVELFLVAVMVLVIAAPALAVAGQHSTAPRADVPFIPGTQPVVPEGDAPDTASAEGLVASQDMDFSAAIERLRAERSAAEESLVMQSDAEKAAAERERVQQLIHNELSIEWKDSTAVGLPYNGKLVDGVMLPVEGQNFFTWDAVHNLMFNPDDRRWGTDELIFTLLAVLDEYRAANPDAPRVAISDLSRPEGGKFGALYGGSGHRSHQNGLDVDIAYPRADGQELGITSVDQIDLELSQDLIDRFVAHGAQFVFIGDNVDVDGPPNIVKAWPYHDDHLHLRIRPDTGALQTAP